MPAPPPPMAPPSPASPIEMPEASGEIVLTGSRAEASDAKTAVPTPTPVVVAPPVAAVSPEARGPGGFRQAPPAGLLTAGDHDDLLNPMLYARYAARAARQLGQSVTGLPSVDTRRTLSIAVQDSGGRARPFVPVTITCADGNSLTLQTLADGRVVLFPSLDRLGDKVTVAAGGIRKTVLIDAENGGQEQAIVIPGGAAPVRKFDLVIALDTTGSMGDEIEFLKSELQSILGDIRRAYPQLDIRVGLVAYRDEGDDYVTRTDRLTGNFATIQKRLNGTDGDGGGDMPEAMDQALIRAVGLDWRPDAVKSLLLVADAPPHDELQGRAFAAAEAARAKRIQIVPVAASDTDDRAEYFMRAVAAATQSRYIFLTDDSGIGNAHAEPNVDCYVVTKLAGSIRRVLAGQIAGTRVEPLPDEVIRVSGTYDKGRCVLPPDFSIQ
ncbi:VWA domain-containing protein [Sphingomonas sinipercae]|nr:vWA domain-containing protein [Sphingomonas sinipercae]